MRSVYGQMRLYSHSAAYFRPLGSRNQSITFRACPVHSAPEVSISLSTPARGSFEDLYLPRSAAAFASRAACLSARSTPTSWGKSESSEGQKIRTTLLAFQN